MVPIGNQQIAGEVTCEALEAPVRFSGWLEFLRVLEDLTIRPVEPRR
jgi:hypothetical protein